MIRHRLAIALSLAAVVSATALAAGPVSAHHSIATCEEVGIWTKSQAARNGTKHWSYSANAYVGYIPPTADCNDPYTGMMRTNYRSTQHTSIYMEDAQGRCMETVAQRHSSGLLRIYGYGCRDTGDTSGDRQYVDISPYYSDTVMLRMESREQGTADTVWDHWVWRYDTHQYIYIGFTSPRSGRAYAWVESSGYNASVEHKTHLTGITGDGSDIGMSFPCPATDDWDGHQAQDSTDYWTSRGRAKFVPGGNSVDTCNGY